MSEILAIRLNNDPDESIPWLVWSPAQQEIIASGDTEHLTKLTSYAKDREVLIIADSSAMTLTEVAIPPGSERQLENVLPFLLEDELAQDVSHTHIALLDKSHGMAKVAIIEHKIMQGWLAALTQADLTPKAILPDCLCLPENEGQFTAAQLHNRWIIRTAHAQGFAAEESLLPIIFKSLQDLNEGELPEVISYSGKPAQDAENWQLAPEELVMEVLTRGAMTSPFNLLSGRYRPSNQYLKYIRYWRNVGIAALVLFTVLVIEQSINIFRLEKQVKELNQQTMQMTKAALPNVKRFPTTSYLKRALDTEVESLSGSGDKSGMLVWLANVGPLLQQSPNITLNTIKFEYAKNEFSFNAQGKDFADFEKLRSLFSAKFKTNLGQLNRAEDKVTGAFVLTKE
ncbi:MAG: type II secretion system protein GspL [Vibrionaceae bacterium]